MTWSIEPSKIDRRPVVKWNGARLCHLSDADFEAAVVAANALGEVVVMDATEVKPGLGAEATRADVIVVSVMVEMERREIDAVDRPRSVDDEAEGECGVSDPDHAAEALLSAEAAAQSNLDDLLSTIAGAETRLAELRGIADTERERVRQLRAEMARRQPTASYPDCPCKQASTGDAA